LSPEAAPENAPIPRASGSGSLKFNRYGGKCMSYSLRNIFIALCVLFLSSYQAQAQEQDDKFRKVTAPEVKEMIQNKKVVIINTLSSLEHELQHIPGSINIPINQIETSSLLPADLSTTLIFYCMATL
jgi:hypothetical protein